MKEFDHCIRM